MMKRRARRAASNGKRPRAERYLADVRRKVCQAGRVGEVSCGCPVCLAKRKSAPEVER